MNSNVNFLLKSSLAALAISFATSHLGLEAVPTVTQFTNSNHSNQIVVAADNNNNAIAVLIDNQSFVPTQTSTVKTTISINGGAWTPLLNLSNTTDYHVNPAVAMDATGTALAIWATVTNPGNLGQLQTAYYSGGVWTTPTPSPLNSAVSTVNGTSVAMDGTGKGLALWSQGTIKASFFSAGTWGAITNVGTTLNSAGVSAAYSVSGKASALWSDFSGPNSIFANIYNGTVWQGLATQLDNNATGSPQSGIDDLGNVIGVWVSTFGSNIIVTRRFDATTLTWSSPVTLSVANGNATPDIAVAPNGDAVAVWRDSANNVYRNVYDVTTNTWSAPILVAANSRFPTISMDSSGNALIGWVTTTGNITTARLPKGSATLDNVTVIKTGAIVNFAMDVALSDAGSTGFNVWIEGLELADTWGATIPMPALAPPTPTGLSVQVCNNRFLSQKDCINTITWDASSDPTVVSYNLYKDAVILANIPITDPLIYVDNVRCMDTVVYTLTAVNGGGEESDPATATVAFVCSPPVCPAGP